MNIKVKEAAYLLSATRDSARFHGINVRIHKGNEQIDFLQGTRTLLRYHPSKDKVQIVVPGKGNNRDVVCNSIVTALRISCNLVLNN